MRVTVNIGLGQPRYSALMTTSVVERRNRAMKEIAAAAESAYIEFPIREAGLEPTIVALLDFPAHWREPDVRWWASCCALAANQDCIAVLFPHGGELVGPHAEKWGDFAPGLFLTPRRQVTL